MGHHKNVAFLSVICLCLLVCSSAPKVAVGTGEPIDVAPVYWIQFKNPNYYGFETEGESTFITDVTIGPFYAETNDSVDIVVINAYFNSGGISSYYQALYSTLYLINVDNFTAWLYGEAHTKYWVCSIPQDGYHYQIQVPETGLYYLLGVGNYSDATTGFAFLQVYLTSDTTGGCIQNTTINNTYNNETTIINEPEEKSTDSGSIPWTGLIPFTGVGVGLIFLYTKYWHRKRMPI